jgi:hypothetical protein
MKPMAEHGVWPIRNSMDLYGDQRVAEQAGRIAEALDSAKEMWRSPRQREGLARTNPNCLARGF